MRGALAEGWIAALQMELAVVLGQLRQTVQDVEEVLLLGCNSAETVAPVWGNCRLLAAIRPPAGSGVGFPPMAFSFLPGFNYRWRVDIGVAEQLGSKFAHSVGGSIQLHLADRYRSKIRDYAGAPGWDDPETHYSGGKVPEMRHSDYSVD